MFARNPGEKLKNLGRGTSISNHLLAGGRMGAGATVGLEDLTIFISLACRLGSAECSALPISLVMSSGRRGRELDELFPGRGGSDFPIAFRVLRFHQLPIVSKYHCWRVAHFER